MQQPLGITAGVGVVLVVLIPFLRKLITDKAETRPVEAATALAAP
jgi:hypothetical protein